MKPVGATFLKLISHMLHDGTPNPNPSISLKTAPTEIAQATSEAAGPRLVQGIAILRAKPEIGTTVSVVSAING